MIQTVLLGDLINIRSGKSRPKEEGDFQVYGGNGVFDSAPSPNMSEPAVIVGRVGAYCGSVYIEKKPFWLSDNALGVTAKSGVDLDFIYYLLKSIDLNSKSVGGAQPLLTQGILNSIFVTVPDLETQKKIADTLGTIDEKIELNRKMNETFEQTGQALFRHYFIDNPEVEKWELGTMDNLFTLTMGLSPKGESYNDTGNGILLLNGAADFTGASITSKRYTSSPTRISKLGDIIFCIRGTIGNVCIGYQEYCLGRGVAAMTPTKNATSYVYFSTVRAIIEMESAASGSVIQGLSKDDIAKRKVKLPPAIILADFEAKARPLIEKTRVNSEEIRTLTIFHDTLLPRLISGKMSL